MSLELGDKAPALVFDDADLDGSVAEIRHGVLALNGQMCTCISRILVQDRVYDSMKARLSEAFTSVRTGDASAADTELGPIIDHANQQRLATIIDRAASAAQMVVHGGIGAGDLAKGYFITPSMFEIDDVHHDLVQDELFGPIVSLERFGDEDEALAKANATR